MVQSRGEKLDRTLDELLKEWQEESAEACPINVKAVAESLGVSRTSLYKNSDVSLGYPDYLRSRKARIEDARRKQEVGRSPQAMAERARRNQLREAQRERDQWKARCEKLQLQIAGMEYHANLNGYDASELWKPLPVNDRADRGRVSLLRKKQR